MKQVPFADRLQKSGLIANSLALLLRLLLVAACVLGLAMGNAITVAGRTGGFPEPNRDGLRLMAGDELTAQDGFRFVSWADTKSALDELSPLSNQAVLLNPGFAIFEGDFESNGLTFSMSGNQPPTVDAGPDRLVTLPQSAVLDGTVTHDGLPDPPGTVTSTWSKVSGPGTVTFTSIPAFPGAEGFGAGSVGGRGGRVIEVTNLDDSGPGSLRACIEASGPRTCVFTVGGTIDLQSGLEVSNPYLTIAGQTAPGGGITLRNVPENRHAALTIKTHHVIVRYLRSRPGPCAPIPPPSTEQTLDAMEILEPAYNVIVDHCSFSWATDETVSTYGSSHDITLQWNVISEGLDDSTHDESIYGHSKGLLMGKGTEARNITVHHNLLAHQLDRNPLVNFPGTSDIRNNVIYNGGNRCSYRDEYGRARGNFVGNYYKAGANSSADPCIKLYSDTAACFEIYLEGNQCLSDTLAELDDQAATYCSSDWRRSAPHPAPGVTTTSAEQAYDDVLADVGANKGLGADGSFFERRDAVDKRIIAEVQTATGRVIDAPSEARNYDPYGLATDILTLTDYTDRGVYDPLDDEGWPVLDPGTPYADSDHDGMADAWELDHFGTLDRGSPDDSRSDFDGDGYTDLEEYLNGTDPRDIIPTPTSVDPLVADATADFSEAGTYVLRLTADDGELTASDEVTVIVNPSVLVTIEARVGASTDDAEERASGSMYLSSSDLELVYDSSNQTVGMRFNGIGIPQGASIVDAYVQFQADETGSVATDLTIRGEDTDNSETFMSTAWNISSRARTTAAVSWSPAPWTTVGEAGIDQRTPNIAGVIQEIVERPGWSSGNSLSIIITGTGERGAEAYDGVASAAPLLHVEYVETPSNYAPAVAITAPTDGSTFSEGESIAFTGTAHDVEDGDLSAGLAWVSSLDGSIGSGASFARPDLSIGVHSINAAVTDSGGLEGSDQISVTVTSPSGNLPPVVSAGPDQTIGLYGSAILEGTVVDDGLPDPPGSVSTTWSQVSGPGTVAFADASALDTTASFSAAGEYVLELSAEDGELIASDQVTVTVFPGSTIRVPEDQPTIQAGIGAAQDGDRVLVSPGTYYETLTLDGKTITLASLFDTTQDPAFIDQTILDGGGAGAVITVTASVGPETKITGFTIQNGGDGINASARLQILHNRFTGNVDAIDYEGGGGICRGNIFENNNDDAVDLDGPTGVIIENNTIVNNNDDGIEVRLGAYSGPILSIIVRGNIISGNGEDGIQLIDYPDLSDRFFLIEHNLIKANAMAGLGLMDNGVTTEDYRAASIPERIHLFNNTFVGNDHGVSGGGNLIALNNLFVDSFQVGVKGMDGESVAAYNLFWNNGTDHQDSNVDLGTTLFADPLLDTEDHLLPGSPGIDAGTAYFERQGETVLDLPGSAYNGAAPDLGWFESDFGPGNQPPVANDDNASTLEDTAVTIDVAANDGDPDGNLDPMTANSLCANGSTGCSDAGHGSLSDNGDGTITYTPDEDYNGVDSFVYEICDSLGACDTATVGVTVTPVNDPPVAVDDSDSTVHDTAVTINAAANDVDPDGNLDLATTNSLCANGSTGCDGAAHGSLTDHGDGTITYAPYADYTGVDSFVYEICDSLDACDTATVSISVMAVNTPPVANDDSASTLEDTAVTIDVAANDGDLDGNLDPATANSSCANGSTGCDGAGHGSLTDHGDGTITYTPDPDYHGGDSFVYEICDSLGACDAATVGITVTPVNDSPVANDDSASTPEDTAVIIDVAANDTDPDGDLVPTSTATTCGACSDATHGTLLNRGDGTFDYLPSQDYYGGDSFVYEICDSQGACDTATVNLTVVAVNDPPVAVDDSDSTMQDTPLMVDVASNDMDPDGNLDPATANTGCAGCAEPAHGSLVNNGDGSFEYRPNGGFAGSDSFVYEICDSLGACDTATVDITVNLSHPVTFEVRVEASTDDAEERASGRIYLTSSDLELVYDSSNQTVGMRFNGVEIPQGASVVNAYVQFQVDETGSGVTDLIIRGEDTDSSSTFGSADWNISSRARTTAAVSWSPVPWTTVGEAGIDQRTPNIVGVIQEIVERPGWSSGNSLSIIITGTGERGAEAYDGVVSAAPLLHVEYFAGPTNQPPVANGEVVSTAEDTPVTIDVAANDSDLDGNLDATTANTTCGTCSGPGHGSAADNGDGTITYMPDGDYHGVDGFVYQICDSLGACDTAVVGITVDAVPDPPVANDDTASTPEDTAVTIVVAGNDTDPDGDLDPQTANTACGTCTVPVNGTLADKGDGSFEYTPKADYEGADGFVYQICDSLGACDTATVDVTITAVNDPPAAADDAGSVTEGGTLNEVAPGVLSNDSDPENDALTVSTTPVTPPSHGSLTLNPDGSYLYVHDGSETASDGFVYEVCDTGALCGTATVDVTVTAVNDPPLAADDTGSVAEGGTLNQAAPGVLSNDSDPENDVLTVTTTPVTLPDHGSLTLNADGSYTYTPVPGFMGSDSFVYEVCDTGPLCDTAKVSIAVTVVNDPPVANDDMADTPEDTPVTVDVVANDSDPDGNLDPTTANSHCAHGSTGCDGAANGILADNGDGTITYTPDPDYAGADGFVYEICDTLGACDTATVGVSVMAVNDPPAANDDGASTPEDTPVTIDVAANDGDPDGNLDPTTANSHCANGSTGCNGAANGTLADNGDGTITYTPDPGYDGADGFVYEICDTLGACDTATVGVTVMVVNDPPVANDDMADTPEDTPVTIDVVANDSDPDGNLDATTANTSCGTCTGPGHGTTADNRDGTITYTPDTDYSGLDSFVYEICDGLGACDTATVSLLVTAVNDPPVAVDDSASTPEDTPVTIDVAANDTDPDGDLVPTSTHTTCGACSDATYGTLVNRGDGTFDYLPSQDYYGGDSFVYEICDSLGACDTATVNLLVTAVNDPPVAVDDSASTPEDTAVTIDVAANDTDPDGDLDATTANTSCGTCSGPGHGMLANNGNGTITYSPNLDYHGVDGFVYEVCDTVGACDTAVVGITVDAVPDPPVAVDDSDSTMQDTPVTVDVAGNDIDPDGDLDPATVNTDCTGCEEPTNGTLSIHGDGTITYSPSPGFDGNDAFVYQICDSGGLCDTAVVRITVNPLVPVTIEVRVATSSDDAEETASGTMSLGNRDLQLVYYRDDQTVGTRFSGLSIPQGATIVKAYVQFKVDEKKNSDPIVLTVQGEAVGNAGTFTAADGDISSRPRTAAAATWSPVAWLTVGEAGPDQQTPDLAAVIQEIVDRPDWTSGNSLVIIITGTGKRVAESYDGDQAGAPLLHVEYYDPGS